MRILHEGAIESQRRFQVGWKPRVRSTRKRHSSESERNTLRSQGVDSQLAEFRVAKRGNEFGLREGRGAQVELNGVD